MEAHLRTLLLSLFALSITLVACPTVENRSGSISGIIRMTPKRAGQSVRATQVMVDLQPSSLAQVGGLNVGQLANIIPGRVIVKFKSGLRVQSVGPLWARVAGRSVNLDALASSFDDELGAYCPDSLHGDRIATLSHHRRTDAQEEKYVRRAQVPPPPLLRWAARTYGRARGGACER